jgi:hypothetical protein
MTYEKRKEMAYRISSALSGRVEDESDGAELRVVFDAPRLTENGLPAIFDVNRLTGENMQAYQLGCIGDLLRSMNNHNVAVAKWDACSRKQEKRHYDKRQIMKNAWAIMRQHEGHRFSDCLRLAWAAAKYGVSILDFGMDLTAWEAKAA